MLEIKMISKQERSFFCVGNLFVYIFLGSPDSRKFDLSLLTDQGKQRRDSHRQNLIKFDQIESIEATTRVHTHTYTYIYTRTHTYTYICVYIYKYNKREAV